MVDRLTMFKKTFAFISKPFPTLKICWNRINSTSVRFKNIFLVNGKKETKLLAFL